MWDIKTIKPDQVHEKMCELLETYNNSEKGLTDITKFHVEYEKIHPFQDGNGHTGRMILFRECLKNGIIPFVICDEDKDLYTHTCIRRKSMSIVYNKDKRSGITYAYESRSYWDKEKKQSRSKRTLIGRVDPETGEITKVDGRCRKNSPYQTVKLTEQQQASGRRKDAIIKELNHP